MIPTALTIAGSDSGGGAGIQADLKTFLDHRVYGMSAITALTAQNTRGVTRVDLVPVEGLLAQLEAVFDDLPVGAVKIGMLPSPDHVRAVADFLGALPEHPPVIIDPVLVATTGAVLAPDGVVGVMKTHLFPLATLITPNTPEARAFGGPAWAMTSPTPVLVTGGDADETELVDRLYLGGEVRELRAPRIATRNTHGTGCTLSSAIAARCARGDALPDAITGAIAYVQGLVAAAASGSLGGGHGPLLHGL